MALLWLLLLTKILRLREYQSKILNVSLFAIDTTAVLDGSQASLQRSLHMLERFGEVSGLKVVCLDRFFKGF